MAAAKFSSLISRLRQTWEDEEVHRTRILQHRVHSHCAGLLLIYYLIDTGFQALCGYSRPASSTIGACIAIK